MKIEVKNKIFFTSYYAKSYITNAKSYTPNRTQYILT